MVLLGKHECHRRDNSRLGSTNQSNCIMKLYIVYFRTMQDSPSVEIQCVTTNEQLANEKFKKAKEEEAEWMKDEDEGSGNWAEACMESFDMTEDCKTGDTIYVLVETLWHEVVETSVSPFTYEANAVAMQIFHKEDVLKDYPDIVPFDDDETFAAALHLCDDSVMVDYYTFVEPVVIE